MSWIYPDDSLYALKPEGNYWYDIFPDPPERSFVIDTSTPSGLRYNDHFVQDKEYSWPSWFTSADGSRGYKWHHAELYKNRERNFASTHVGPNYNPLTPEYNKVTKRHEYPHAEPNAAPAYAIENPLSNNATFGGFPNLIFSDFRHYIFPPPLGFAGTPYEVTISEPIQRKSWGGKYVGLQRISVWSPYSESTWIDFANANAYNKSLEASSIWS